MKKKTKEQERKVQQQCLRKRIQTTFIDSGFDLIPTRDHNFEIGNRRVEVDALYIYENIWLFCEDTISTEKGHIRKTKESYEEIKNNFDEYIGKLSRKFSNKSDAIMKYDKSRIKTFCLYFCDKKLSLESRDYQLFSTIKFVTPETLKYLHWISQCIKNSARYEIFRFLNIKKAEIGDASSVSHDARIEATIIHPISSTGLRDKVQVVSFMISAEVLLETCYVLRKDDWSESMWLYQRLIDKKKIDSLRKFIESNEESFYNNIIVALPDDIKFTKEGVNCTLEEIKAFEGNVKLSFPLEMNSICVIDGQHRIFAYYESGKESVQENRITKLRKKLHLLVTGLIFPSDMSEEKRIQIQGKIFLDINRNAKRIPQHVLLRIKRIMEPIASESIAQYVIEKLNMNGPFCNLLQVNALDRGGIKTATIVNFALCNCVNPTPPTGKKTLFSFWDGDKDVFFQHDKDAIEEYAQFCSSEISVFFNAIKNSFYDEWSDKQSKLLSVTSINGFIIAFTHTLSSIGLRGYQYYLDLFKNWEYDFSKKNFPYTSSQYKKFSLIVLKDVFNIDTQ